MEQYISKDALVAEIDRLEKKNNESENVYDFGTVHALKSIRSFINTHEVKEIGVDLGDPKGDKSAKHIIDTKTLEVKEVDLDFMLHEYWELSPKITIDCLESATMTKDEMIEFAKHFFELGLQTRTDKELVEEVYSHIDSIKDTSDRMTSGNFMHNRAAIKFSANTIAKVLELMGLKAQKGE